MTSTVLLPTPRSIALGRELVSGAELAAAITPSLPAEGYRIDIGTERVVVDAGGPIGLLHARRTLDQLRRCHGGSLPVGVIEDWPDLAVRGVLLDVSRDKVPTMATVEALIDRLASWKINQVQLAMEHTFAYAGREEVWADASPFTAAEVRSLDGFCRERGVDLVPHQNCLGHFERWLRHDRYRPLAIRPDGWEDADGRWRAPTTLDPDNPGAIALVRSLLGELLDCFGSAKVHVGLDEPFELPAERMDGYVAWMRALRAAPELEGREMLVWGDVLLGHPGTMSAVPDGVTVCAWGYEADLSHRRGVGLITSGGFPCWVCPGTSSWNSIVGRWTNMRGNTADAVESARACRARGAMTTDWGDRGHLQPLPVSEPGLAYAAATMWCLPANRDLDLDAALDVHVFQDRAGLVGSILHRLGDLYALVGERRPNESTLVRHGYFPEDAVTCLSPDDLDVVDDVLAGVVRDLRSVDLERSDGAQVAAELGWATAYVQHLVGDARARLAGDGRLASVPPDGRRALAVELAPLIDDYRRVWAGRNRPGGLADSAAWIERLLASYAV